MTPSSTPNPSITPSNTATPTPTVTPTPTSTPTFFPFVMSYSVIGGTEACNNSGSTATYYSNTPSLSTFTFLATDSGLTTPAVDGYYCLSIGCPNDTGNKWIRVTGGSGAITQAAYC